MSDVRLGTADRWFLSWGAYAILVTRLVPVVSFDIVSYAAGLTLVGFWRFMLATMVGMAPATFLYAYLGGQAPQYVQVLLVAFGVVIAGAVVAAVLRRRRQGKRIPLVEEEQTVDKSEENFDDQADG